MTNDLRPFRVDVPQAALDDLADRLRRTRWPHEAAGSGSRYGVPVGLVRSRAEHWLDRFDWRAHEARLNAHPQLTTEIDGETIHLLHVRSARPDAVPLVLTHGWPGTVAEFLDVVEPLTAPPAGQPAFHLVVPSLPGSGFGGPTRGVGWGIDRTARAWAELMARLGYARFVAAGNDAGSMVSTALARLVPERVLGVHVTQIFSFPSGDPAELADLGPEDRGAMARLQWFGETLSTFQLLHSAQPQTVSFALADSPVGLLAWNGQLFPAAADPDFVLANVATHWLTGTTGSALRLYYESAHTDVPPAGPSAVPIGLAMFGSDFQSVRRFAERDHTRILSWNRYGVVGPEADGPGSTGHYAPHEHPETWVADLRAFVGLL